MEKLYSVSGMTCTNCVSAVEKSIKGIEGVKSVSVSLMNKSARVEMTDGVSDDAIFSAVKKAGYTATAYNKNGKDGQAKRLKTRFIVSVFLLFPLMYFSMGNMVKLPLFSDGRINLTVSLVFATAIIFINIKYYINGIKAVINKSPNMDTLVSLGSFSAYLYSVIVTVICYAKKGSITPHAFFESSAMVLTLVTLGKWLEELTKEKTGSEIDKLVSLIPQTATVIVKGEEKAVKIEEIKKGDILLIKAGERIAVDGVVTEGNATADKSAITGESIPVEAYSGTEVISGSVLLSGVIKVKSTTDFKDSVFSKIIDRVRRASESKAPVQKLADKISGIFVSTVCLISLITFALWLIISKDIYSSVKYAICVLVVSCPCSLGLATPVAVMAGTGKGASLGILYKNATVLQKSAKINCVMLDKTATLTTGKPIVSGYYNYSEMKNEEIFSIVYSLEKNSNHPLASAISSFCGQQKGKKVENFEYIIGKGATGEVDGRKYYLGNFKTAPENKEFFGKTVVTFSDGVNLISAFAVSDTLKEGGEQAVKLLNDGKIKTVMITGDNVSSARAVAESCGIKEFSAEVLPEGKAQEVIKYKESGYITAFVGDGINDSPALKTADIGISLANGTDIAIECADIVLTGSLVSIKDVIGLSKKTNSVIKGNLFWALFYNVLLIPIAGGVFAYFNFTLTPWIASACMSVSSLFVVLNALRIRNYKKTTVNKGEKKMKIKVEGMMCNHCAMRVEEALKGIDGVKEVKVDLKKKTAEFDGTDYENAKQAVEKAGYKVVGEVKK